MNNIRNTPIWRASESTLNNKPVVDFNDEADRMWTTYNFRDGAQVTKWRNEGYTAIGVALHWPKEWESERLISSNGGNYISVSMASRLTATTSMADGRGGQTRQSMKVPDGYDTNGT